MGIADEAFGSYEDADKPVTNLLEKGRYIATTKDILKGWVSDAGNKCMKFLFDVNGHHIYETIMLTGSMAYKWKQYLYGINMRKKEQYSFFQKVQHIENIEEFVEFLKNKSGFIGKKITVDVGVKDGWNVINYFSAIEQEVAPIKGVEPEVETESTSPVEADDGL